MADDYERTWDGHPISKETPYGATIVVFRRSSGTGREPEFLVLHRGHNGPDYEGDWAWGPPAGACYPGEAIDDCARRELLEETGLRLAVHQTQAGSADWLVYLAEAPEHAAVGLSGEHDRHIWLPVDQAAECLAPEVVRAHFAAAAGEVPPDRRGLSL